MKYANYHYTYKKTLNIGDYIQILAIDYVYSKMGICKKDIVYIDVEDLNSYNGETVILPVALLNTLAYGDSIRAKYSPKIIPVFLCFTSNVTTLNQEDINFFHQNEPIGCRDTHTALLLRSYGVRAYVNGCLTALLPKADIDRSNLKNVYFVDTPEGIEDYAPVKVKENSVYLSHIMLTPDRTHTFDPFKETEKILNTYINDAALIITSRLHCASPCMAYGIPVILAHDFFPHRFTWLDKFLPFYAPSQFSNIKWEQSPVDYEEHKRTILANVMNQLVSTYEKYSPLFTISDFFEDMPRTETRNEAVDKSIKFIENKWKKSDEFLYSIWGFTDFTYSICNYIADNYPNAKLTYVYDKRKVHFKGKDSIDPSHISDNPEDFIFIGITARTDEAEDLMKKLRRDPETYLLMYNPRKPE